MRRDGTGERATHGSHAGREVVAGLANDASVTEVAFEAVRMAHDLHAQVRFVRVIPDGTAPDDRHVLECITFAAALKALHGHPRMRATFDYPTGDPALLLVERSRGALALVVGTDRAGKYATGSVARFCQLNAACRVRIVGQGAT